MERQYREKREIQQALKQQERERQKALKREELARQAREKQLREKQAKEREARMRKDLNLARIDPSMLLLNDTVINNDLFQDTIHGMIYQYARPAGNDAEEYYQTWFWHIPREIYFGLSVAEKLEQFGPAYFSFNENPATASPDHVDSMIEQIDRYRRVLKLATDKYSPYWYAMAHTCHVLVVLEYLMMVHLMPNYHWYIITTPSHAFVADRHPKDILDNPSAPTLYFDILTESVDDLLEVAGLRNWGSPTDVHTYFKQLVEDNMITLP